MEHRQVVARNSAPTPTGADTTVCQGVQSYFCRWRRLYVDGVLAAQLDGNSTLPDGSPVPSVDGGLQVAAGTALATARF